MTQRAMTRNAADPSQVRTAERLEKRRQERFARALAATINTVEGRIVFAELLRRAGVYRSIWHPSSEIHYNAGRQDYGHELMATLTDLSLDHFLKMEQEEWAWLRQEQATTDAAHASRQGKADTDDNPRAG